MKKNLLLFILVTFTFQFSFSQRIITGLDANKVIDEAKLIRYVDRSPYPNHIGFTPQTNYSGDKSKWMQVKLKLPKEYTLQLTKEEKDNIGYVHQKYIQLYKGIPVEYGVYKAHYSGELLESINGDIYSVNDLDVNPVITAEDAIEKAKNYVDADTYKWQDGKRNSANYYPTTELMVLVHNKKSYLVYKVDIYSIEPLSRKYVYVDAKNGKIITEMERLHDVDTPGTASTVYSGIRPITMDFNGTDYTLTESVRNLETINSATMLTYSNPTTAWSLSGLDQYALDGHWASEMTYDFFLTAFGRDGLDGANYHLVSYINEGPGFGNAYWDGSTIHYGDGDGSFFLTPLTTVGIVGHEAAHGVTQFTAGLIYAGESGAMNESFSDIFGLCVDKYARNVDLNLNATWLVGAECTGGAGFRDMSNPNFFSMADTYGGTFWNAGDIVHYDSGVQNFWFHLLTMGGSGTNDNSDAYSVTGIGIADAQAIAYRSLAFYLTPGSGFADSRYYSSLAAEDLFGACSQQVASTIDAWYAVGVGGPYANITTASFDFGVPVSCSLPAAVSFTNYSFNGSSYLWDFGDGDTSTLANPTHAYGSIGTFNVTLIASGCGINVSDTFVIPVTVTTGSTVLNLDPLQDYDLSCCTGGLFDSGGPGGNYPDGEASNASITVPAGQVVNLVFTSFATEFGYDYVNIYDGPNSLSPQIGSYSGNTLPNGGASIFSTGNQMYVEFSSDGSIIGAGFELTWTCQPPDVPTAAFTSTFLTAVCVGSSIDYFNNSIYEDSVSWIFQGGAPGASNADTVSVLYNTVGTFTTWLYANNMLGMDSTVTTITVVPLPVPVITLGGTTLSTTITFATYQWYLNGSPIGGATSQTYDITSGGAYYCEVTDANGCPGTSNTIISTLALDPNSMASIVIYPNPASMVLLINNPLLVNGNYIISMMNMLGEVIYTSTQYAQQGMIDLSSIRAGSYLVRISQDDWEVTRKVVVVK